MKKQVLSVCVLREVTEQIWVQFGPETEVTLALGDPHHLSYAVRQGNDVGFHKLLKLYHFHPQHDS